LLKVACSGPAVSRTRSLSVTSPILYHYTIAPMVGLYINVTLRLTLTAFEIVIDHVNSVIVAGGYGVQPSPSVIWPTPSYHTEIYHGGSVPSPLHPVQLGSSLVLPVLILI